MDLKAVHPSSSMLKLMQQMDPRVTYFGSLVSKQELLHQITQRRKEKEAKQSSTATWGTPEQAQANTQDRDTSERHGLARDLLSVQRVFETAGLYHANGDEGDQTVVEMHPTSASDKASIFFRKAHR